MHNVIRSLGLVDSWKVAANNRKLTHDFTTPFNSKFCSIYRRLAPNSNVKLWPPIRPPPFGELEWTKGVENGTNRNVVTTVLFNEYIHITGLSCTVWPQYTTQQTDDRQTDGQSDRNIGRLIDKNLCTPFNRLKPKWFLNSKAKYLGTPA